jgi:hypothetical protein
VVFAERGERRVERISTMSSPASRARSASSAPAARPPTGKSVHTESEPGATPCASATPMRIVSTGGGLPAGRGRLSASVGRISSRNQPHGVAPSSPTLIGAPRSIQRAIVIFSSM